MSRSVTPFFRLISISFLVLTLLGVFIRAMIPAGFMPDVSLHAGTPLVICSGLESKTIYVDENGKPASEHKVEAPCDFSLNNNALKPVVFISSLFVPYVSAWVMPERAVEITVSQLRNFAEARGPPAFSI